MKKQTIYLDTSVFSIYYDDRDPALQSLTKKFWEQRNTFDVFISDIVVNEIQQTKDLKKRDALIQLTEGTQNLTVTDECESLADEYISRDIIPKKHRNDAVHIAVAVINSMDYLISWNFEHIVKVKTKRMVGLVDLERGYKPIEIIAPPELLQ